MSLFDTEVEDSSVEQEFENTVQQTIQSTTEDTEDKEITEKAESGCTNVVAYPTEKLILSTILLLLYRRRV